MLTDLLLLLSPVVIHLVIRLARLDAAAFHEWLEDWCPCGA